MLTIDQQTKDAVAVLTASGVLDQAEIHKLREAVARNIRKHQFHLVLNLRHVGMIEYPSFGVLLELLSELQQYGGGLKLACANLHTQRMLRLIGLCRVLMCFDTEAEAIRQYQKEAA